MNTRENRRAKTRKTIRGTKDVPRLVVFRSNKYLYGQMIDDSKGQTLVSADRLADPVKLGEEIAQKAQKKGIKKIVFDRAGYKYHGKVKKIAETVRTAGLEF